jgi:hypothetical protein
MTSVRKHALRDTWYEVLRGASVETVSIFVQYRASFSNALVPQLQLWHLHCTHAYSNVRSAFTSAAVQFLSRKEPALTVGTRRRRPRQHNTYFRVLTPAGGLRSKLTPAVRCVIRAPTNALYRLRSKLFQLPVTCVSNRTSHDMHHTISEEYF